MELIDRSAVALVGLLRAGKISPHDCLKALEARIAVVEPRVNALPTLCFERAHAAADAMMARPLAERGLLAGLPVAIKDLSDVAGVRTTYGSPIFADHVPAASDLTVSVIEGQGGVVYAKSNTPEFGAGANTFNAVFGATRNPWNLSRSAAGSSGGAAAALASGTAWLAHGSDLAGSCRSPASFCGVVGLRPSPGRVPQSRKTSLDSTLGVQGPLARTVADCALFLDAMVGEDPRDPISKPPPRGSFLAAVEAGGRPRRVAYSPDLGITPVDPQIAAITRAAALRLEAAGVIVEEAHPDFSAAHETFQTLRALAFAVNFSGLLRTRRDELKPEVVWNIERGLALTPPQIVQAEHARAAMAAGAAAFFETYDLLLCPAAITAAFPVEERYLRECAGRTFDTYVDWLAIVYAPTLICAPALSLPCGFTQAGLPVGLQIIGPSGADARVLVGAKLLEDMLALDTGRVVEPREGL